MSATTSAAGRASLDRPLLRMSELSERSGVSAGAIRYYLREGLLGDGEDIVRTSRNMAYYPPGYVERIELIKRLQEERFMPLRVIKRALAEDPERVRALIELEDRILERALKSAEERSRVSMKAVRERYEIPRNVLARLAEIGVLTPTRGGYDQDDVKIIEAIASFRAGGYEEALGFTVYDTLRYRDALEPLVREEVHALLDRLAGEVDVERAMEIVAAGVEPLRELLGAMHSKMLLAELRRQRARGWAGLRAGRAGVYRRLPERAVMLDDAEAMGKRDATREGPREGSEGCAVLAFHDQEVLPAVALGLSEETQLRGVLTDDSREV
jgi:DNA-binding transcriptional MerR regulator